MTLIHMRVVQVSGPEKLLPTPVYNSSNRQPKAERLWSSKDFKISLTSRWCSVGVDNIDSSVSANSQQTAVSNLIEEGGTVQTFSNRVEARDADMLLP